MKKIYTYFVILFLSSLQIGGYAQITEGFETLNCNNSGNHFFNGCLEDWISASRSTDVVTSITLDNVTINPFEGNRFVHLSALHSGGCNIPAERIRTDGIILNYEFLAGETYTINYALRGEVGTQTKNIVQWLLTDGRNNQSGGLSCNNTAGRAPDILVDDLEVKVHIFDESTSWTEFSETFVPTEDFSQLWLRIETTPKFSDTGDAQSDFFLDDFELLDCSDEYSSDFNMAPSSNINGEVQVFASAFPNPGPTGHWWDVYYAPNGSINGNDQVPGNPVQTGSPTAFFDQNMYINEWYYIKHGIWSLVDCFDWREHRRTFRIQAHNKGESNGGSDYFIEIIDLEFKPSEEYILKMTELVNAGEDPFELMQKTSPHPNDLTRSPSDYLRMVYNFPNPFSDQTTIEYIVDKATNLSIYVFDIRGKIVATLLQNEYKSPGVHQVNFDGSLHGPGIYYYTIQARDFKQTKKMTLVK